MIGLAIGCILAYFIFRLSAALNRACSEIEDLQAENATLHDELREARASLPRDYQLSAILARSEFRTATSSNELDRDGGEWLMSDVHERIERQRDLGTAQSKKQHPKAVNAIAGNYDRDAYLAILSPETRARLLDFQHRATVGGLSADDN